MSSSVLFDAPGPKARRRSQITSVVTIVVVAAVAAWGIWTLAQPVDSGGITVPGRFDPSRWNIFLDPGVWSFILDGVLNTLRAALVAAVIALILGIAFSLMRSSEIAWVRIPTTWLLEFLRGMPLRRAMLTEHAAGPSFRYRQRTTDLLDRLAATGGA